MTGRPWHCPWLIRPAMPANSMKVLAVLVLLLPAFLPAAHAETLIGDVRVVDGDTLAFEGLGVKVRLDGIDAPESKQTCEGADGNRYECGPVRCEGDVFHAGRG